MSSDPRNLRNIPPETLAMAQAVSRRNGSSVADILRQALIIGCAIELVKAGPDQAGEYAGFDELYLAKSLRRLLAAPIDFLLEHGQHPYQAALSASAPSAAILPQTAAPAVDNTPDTAFDTAMADELEEMGFGLGLSLEMEAPVGIS